MVFAGSGGGGGVQQQLGTMPFGGPVRVPAPSSGGGGKGPAGPGGTQELQHGHGKASEKGTYHETDVLPPRRDIPGGQGGIRQATGRL